MPRADRRCVNPPANGHGTDHWPRRSLTAGRAITNTGAGDVAAFSPTADGTIGKALADAGGRVYAVGSSRDRACRLTISASGPP